MTVIPIRRILSDAEARRDRADRIDALTVDRSRHQGAAIVSLDLLSERPEAERQHKANERIAQVRDRLEAKGITRSVAFRLLWQRAARRVNAERVRALRRRP